MRSVPEPPGVARRPHRPGRHPRRGPAALRRAGPRRRHRARDRHRRGGVARPRAAPLRQQGRAARRRRRARGGRVRRDARRARRGRDGGGAHRGQHGLARRGVRRRLPGGLAVAGVPAPPAPLRRPGGRRPGRPLARDDRSPCSSSSRRAGVARPSLDRDVRAALLLVSDLAVVLLAPQLRPVLGEDVLYHRRHRPAGRPRPPTSTPTAPSTPGRRPSRPHQRTRPTRTGPDPPTDHRHRRRSTVSTDDVVRIEGLVKEFGSFRALDGLDLEVRRGRGPRLPRPQRRRQVHDHPGPPRTGPRRRRLVSLFGGDPWREAARLHAPALLPPRRRLALGRRSPAVSASTCSRRPAAGSTNERRADLVERFDLDPTKRARDYSKGNRQKVALVAALATDAELLVLDEPTSGLDPLMEQHLPGGGARAAGRGRHGAAVEPPPRRGRGARRPGEHHPARPDGGERHPARPAPAHPHQGARRHRWRPRRSGCDAGGRRPRDRAARRPRRHPLQHRPGPPRRRRRPPPPGRHPHPHGGPTEPGRALPQHLRGRRPRAGGGRPRRAATPRRRRQARRRPRPGPSRVRPTAPAGPTAGGAHAGDLDDSLPEGDGRHRAGGSAR